MDYFVDVQLLDRLLVVCACVFDNVVDVFGSEAFVDETFEGVTVLVD
jgi:hypothetical protein